MYESDGVAKFNYDRMHDTEIRNAMLCSITSWLASVYVWGVGEMGSGAQHSRISICEKQT